MSREPLSILESSAMKKASLAFLAYTAGTAAMTNKNISDGTALVSVSKTF